MAQPAPRPEVSRRQGHSDPGRLALRGAQEDLRPQRQRGVRHLALGLVWITQAIFYGLCWLDGTAARPCCSTWSSASSTSSAWCSGRRTSSISPILLIISALALFLFTAVAGRLFCGYACPQTVYTEIFMWVEKKIEGDRSRA
jgi:polyferredoxin